MIELNLRFGKARQEPSPAPAQQPSASPVAKAGHSPATPAGISTAAAIAKAMPEWISREQGKGNIAAVRNAYGGYGDAYGRLPFQALRQLADQADLVRAAIEAVKNAVRAQDWALKSEDKREVPPEAEALLSRPDGANEWDVWASLVLEEILVGDNLTVFPWWKGGRAVKFEVIDGDTVTAKPGKDGRLPAPPSTAFEQLTATGQKLFTADQLWYLPQCARVRSLRGYSPLERVVNRASVNMSKTLKDLRRWTEGGFPGALVPAPDGMTSAEAEAWQKVLDDAARNPVFENRIRVLPPASKGSVVQLQPPKFDKEHEEILIRVIFHCFGVDPTSMISQVNYSTADALERWASLQGLRPWLWALKSLADRMLAAAGWPWLSFEWEAERNAAAITQKESTIKDFRSGMLSWEEARERLGMSSEDGAELDGKHFFTEGSLSAFDPLSASTPEPALSDGGGEAETGGGGLPPALLAMQDKMKAAAGAQQAPPDPALQKADLKRWEAVVTKAVAAGKVPRSFHSEAISKAVRFRVEKGLSAGLGRAAFAKAMAKDQAKTVETSEAAQATLDDGSKALSSYLARVIAALSDAASTELGAVSKAVPADAIPVPSITDWRGIVRWLEDVYEAGVSDASELVGYGTALSEAAAAYAKERAGLLIGRRWDGDAGVWVEVPGSPYNITETLRSQVATVTEQAIKDGWGYADLTAKLSEQFEPQARALMIARTEMAEAYNKGVLADYGAQGMEVVEVLDGGGAGSCPECDAANGQIWTVAYSLAHSTEHPNCTRAFSPRPDLTAEDADET